MLYFKHEREKEFLERFTKKTLTKQKTLTIFYRELNDGTDDLMIQNQSSKKKDKKMTTETTKTALELFVEKNGKDVTSYSAATMKEYMKLKSAEDAANSEELKAYKDICSELGLVPSKSVTSFYTRNVKSQEKVVRVETGISYKIDGISFHITSGLTPKTATPEAIKNRHTKFVMALNAIES